MTNIDNGFWVFGYGSLVWQPGFEFAEREIARMEGFSRSFCMWSIHHRGTEDDPGLVLALDAAPESYCDGVAFFVPPQTAQQTIDYLRERELVSAAYLEQVHSATLRDGRVVECVSYVVDRDHVQYCGGLSLERQAEVIAKAVGGRGPNTEYLVEVNRHLGELGLPDPDLEWLTQRVLELSVTA